MSRRLGWQIQVQLVGRDCLEYRHPKDRADADWQLAGVLASEPAEMVRRTRIRTEPAPIAADDLF